MSATVSLEPGSTLICFTDGVTDELGDGDLDEGLEGLRQLVGALPIDASPEDIIDAIKRTALHSGDDVAAVAIRVS